MASKYWVGGSGYWSDATNHWATSSGGSPGAGNLPISSDDVFIDTNSGFGAGGTITTDVGSPEIHNFTSTTGNAYTINFVELPDKLFYLNGSIVLESTLSLGNLRVLILQSSSSETITSNGFEFQCELDIASSGTFTLQDNLASTAEIYHYGGTFDANDKDITAWDYYTDNSVPGVTLNMGSGTWILTGDDVNGPDPPFTIDTSLGDVTVNAEGSTIKLTNTSVENKTFAGAGHTFNNVWIAGNGTGSFIFTGSNTFNDLKIDAGNTVKFTESTTTTVTSFTAVGTAGNLIILDSVDGATQHTLSKTSGIVDCDYLNLSNSNATGGAAWYAGWHSLDTTNNDGWIFQGGPGHTTTSSSTTTTTSTSTSTSSSTSTSTSTSSTTTQPVDIRAIWGFTKKEKLFGEIYIV